MKNPETLLGSLEFVIHQNYGHDASFRLASKVKYLNSDLLLLSWHSELGYNTSNRLQRMLNKIQWMNYKNNNVYKTEVKETIHILVFTIKNLKSAETYKSRQVLLSLKQFILASANSYCKFHIFLIYNVLYFSLWTSTPYFLCFPFFFIDRLSMFSFPFCWSHLKAETAHLVNSSLFRKRSIIGQLNVTAETADNEEQYTLSKIIYIEFQDSYSFLWSFLW